MTGDRSVESVPRPRRRWWQFSLLTFLAFVTLIGVVLGCWFRPFTVEEREGTMTMRFTCRRDWRGNVFRDGPAMGAGLYGGVAATAVGYYVNGRREGIWQVRANEGQLLLQVSFRRDKRHGPEAEWHANGIKGFEASFVDDEPDGQVTYWDTEGRIVLQGTYREGQPWSGVCWERWGHAYIAYYENGLVVPLEAHDERAQHLSRALEYHVGQSQHSAGLVPE